MKKTKHIKKNMGISSDHLVELRHATLIASTGSSLRLSGFKVTDKEVEQIIQKLS